MSSIYEVSSVDVILQKSAPPTFVVKASGTTRTGGYTDPRLERRVYITPPLDGIQEYDFVATEPSGPAPDAITPVEAEDEWPDPPSWLRGARVHSETNHREAVLAGQVRSPEP